MSAASDLEQRLYKAIGPKPATLAGVEWGTPADPELVEELLEQYEGEAYKAGRGGRGGLIMVHQANVPLLAKVAEDLVERGVDFRVEGAVRLATHPAPRILGCLELKSVGAGLTADDYLKILTTYTRESSIALPPSVVSDASEEVWREYLAIRRGVDVVREQYDQEGIVDAFSLLEIIRLGRAEDYLSALVPLSRNAAAGDMLQVLLTSNRMPSLAQIREIDHALNKTAINNRILKQEPYLRAGGWRIVKAFVLNSSKPDKYRKLVPMVVQHGLNDPDLYNVIRLSKSLPEALSRLSEPADLEAVLNQCPVKEALGKYPDSVGSILRSRCLEPQQVRALVGRRARKETFGQALTEVLAPN